MNYSLTRLLKSKGKTSALYRISIRQFCDQQFKLATKAESFRFINKVKAFFNKRILMFRLLFYSSFVLIGFTIMRYSNNINYAKNVTPVFFIQNNASENMFYNVAGVIKPGTINIIKGSDELSFIITDYEHEMVVYFKGVIPPNFLEGNTVIATGSITDRKKPEILMCNKIATEHAYNSDTWLNRQLTAGDKNRQEIIDEMMKKQNKESKYTKMS